VVDHHEVVRGAMHLREGEGAHGRARLRSTRMTSFFSPAGSSSTRSVSLAGSRNGCQSLSRFLVLERAQQPRAAAQLELELAVALEVGETDQRRILRRHGEYARHAETVAQRIDDGAAQRARGARIEQAQLQRARDGCSAVSSIVVSTGARTSRSGSNERLKSRSANAHSR